MGDALTIIITKPFLNIEYGKCPKIMQVLYLCYNITFKTDLPPKVIAFNIPLFWRERFRSHSATGNTYDMVEDSNTGDMADGIATSSKNTLNFPKLHASTASSKCAKPKD